MAYTPPARDNIVLVVGGGYSPPARDSIELQLGDDPLAKPPALTVTSPGLSQPAGTLKVTWTPDALKEPNPQMTHVVVEYSQDGSNWQSGGEAPVDSPPAYITELYQGIFYHVRIRCKTALSPSPKLSPPSGSDGAYTDFLLEVTSCKDSVGNVLDGAAILALPRQELLDQVTYTETGQDLPALTYKRCNRTGSQGTCGVQIPGGKGKAVVVMFPTGEDVGGDIDGAVLTED